MAPCSSRAFLHSQRGRAAFLEAAVVISLLAILPACSDVKASRTDRDEAKLVGPVSSVVEKDSLYISEYRYAKDGRLVEVERQCIRKMLCSDGPRTKTTKYEHDQAGKKVLGVEYDKNQSVVSREAYAYNVNGYLSANVHASGSGELLWGTFQWYDTRGNKIGDTHILGIVGAARSIGRSDYIYDENGREIKGIGYTEEGNISLEYRKTYDKEGHLQEAIGYLPGGGVDMKRVYTYDARGVEVGSSLYNAQGVLDVRFTSQYEYDNFGNWTKQLYQKWENQQGKEVLKETHVTERTIAYYE